MTHLNFKTQLVSWKSALCDVTEGTNASPQFTTTPPDVGPVLCGHLLFVSFQTWMDKQSISVSRKLKNLAF